MQSVWGFIRTCKSDVDRENPKGFTKTTDINCTNEVSWYSYDY